MRDPRPFAVLWLVGGCLQDEPTYGAQLQAITSRWAAPVSATASTTAAGSSPLYGVDGDTSTSWNSGAIATQWLQVDLGAAYNLELIRLVVEQNPAGQTSHVIYGGATPTTMVQIGSYTGATQSGSILYVPVAARGIRYVQIQTTQSPSWVAWRDMAFEVGEGSVFEAEDPAAVHQVGRAEADGWAADPAIDLSQGYLYAGPSTGVAQGWNIVRLKVLSTTVPAPDDFGSAGDFELWDMTSGTRLRSEQMAKRDFAPPAYREFELPFDADAVRSYAFRVFYNRGAQIRADRVIVQPQLTSCPAEFLLTTPIASQCCYASYNGVRHTLFYNASTNQLVDRRRNPTGMACRASDGMSPCSGAACYYGPLGFARATMSTPTSYWSVARSAGSGQLADCVIQTSGSPIPRTFPDVIGSGATGLGCPGGGTGAGAWDY